MDKGYEKTIKLIEILPRLFEREGFIIEYRSGKDLPANYFVKKIFKFRKGDIEVGTLHVGFYSESTYVTVNFVRIDKNVFANNIGFIIKEDEWKASILRTNIKKLKNGIIKAAKIVENYLKEERRKLILQDLD